jgi:hypothetical protein
MPWLTQAASAPDWSGQTSAMQPHVANYNDLILCHNGSLPAGGDAFNPASWKPYNFFAINLDSSKGAVGSLRWMKSYDPPSGNITVGYGGYDFESRVWLQEYKETSQWVGYDMDSGDKIWGPTEPQNPWDYYGTPGMEDRIAMMAYGKVYSGMFSGTIYCYDAKNGNLLWTYGNGGEGNSTTSGYYGGYGIYPTMIMAIGNDVIYTVTTEHTVSTPIYKGALTRAINATDGTEIWTLSSFTASFHSASFAIADGFSTWWNGLDNQIYVTGRGPSRTTVNAPLASVTQGNSLVISGTVTDIAAGTLQDEPVARFPDGVPAVSDASITQWMEYVYQQKPRPTDVTGVEVVLSVLDANNNLREIGRATSDANGFYSLQWTPDITGKFTVYATFEGTNAYWPSQAQAAFAVDPAPIVATPTESSTNTNTFDVYGTIAIIVAIVVVGAIIALLVLRKR